MTAFNGLVNSLTKGSVGLFSAVFERTLFIMFSSRNLIQWSVDIPCSNSFEETTWNISIFTGSIRKFRSLSCQSTFCSGTGLQLLV